MLRMAPSAESCKPEHAGSRQERSVAEVRNQHMGKRGDREAGEGDVEREAGGQQGGQGRTSGCWPNSNFRLQAFIKKCELVDNKSGSSSRRVIPAHESSGDWRSW